LSIMSTDGNKKENSNEISRTSKALGKIFMAPANFVMDKLPSSDKPLRILVTMHNIEFFYNNAVENGLGYWVFYIVREYFRKRGIPVVLFLKSVKTSCKIQDVLKFLERNKIDAVIPADISDTFFLCSHLPSIQEHTKIALCPAVETYESLEDKWRTYNFCLDNGIATPETKKLEDVDELEFPFFLKVSSGTNGGRGVWLIPDQSAFDKAMFEKVNKECTADLHNLHLVQTPTFGTIICAEVVYDHGKPLGFWFSQSVAADDLAGVGKSYIFSCCKKEGQASHVGVNLNDEQWEAVTDIFHKVGAGANYHGMTDIEFIIAGPDNVNAEEGSVWLLEMNPRFSGAIHTTLSNPGFLDLYFAVLLGTADRDAPIINFCTDTEMMADFKAFSPSSFYASNPRVVLHCRNWGLFSDVPIRQKGDKMKIKKREKGEGGE